MERKFPIPTLTEKTWNQLQSYLDVLAHKLNKLSDKNNGDTLLECHILMGMIDMVLGRTFELDEAFTTIKKEMVTRNDYWVLCSDYQVLMSDPPKYQAIIKHYHSDNGINYDDLKRCCKECDKVFSKEHDAIDCCKDMHFYDYEIVDVNIDDVEQIVINNADYESIV